MNTVVNFMGAMETLALTITITGGIILVLYAIKGYLEGRYPDANKTITVVKQEQVTVNITDNSVTSQLDHISEDMDNLEKRISILTMKSEMLKKSITNVELRLHDKEDALALVKTTMPEEVFKVQSMVDSIEIDNIRLTLIGLNEKLMTTEESITKCTHKMDDLNEKYNSIIRKEYEKQQA